MVRVVFQRFPDLTNRRIDAALGIHKYVVTPNLGNHLFPSDKSPTLLEQKKQKVQGNAFEFDRAASVAQLIALSIRLKTCEAENVVQCKARRPFFPDVLVDHPALLELG